MEKTETDGDRRSGEAEKWRESKVKGDKDRVSQRKRSKRQEWEKQTTEESLLVSSLSSLVSPGFGPPLLFFGFHSNREGSTKSAYTFKSFLSA